MEYLIILNPNTRINSIYCNARGFPEIFTTYNAAKDFANKSGAGIGFFGNWTGLILKQKKNEYLRIKRT
jgi:hypothetical protein